MNDSEHFGDMRTRPDIIRLTRTFGLLYGISAGFGFAVASWGLDAYMLGTAHGYLPWVKFTIGLILCMLVGGVTGWLHARLKLTPVGVLGWLGLGVFFAWLTIALPLEITPRVLGLLDAELGGLLDYNKDIEFAWFLGVALMWITPFILIIGVMQSPLVEPAVFTTTASGRIVPFVVCILVVGIASVISDSLVNARLRDSVLAMDKTIQFVLDTRGQEVDRTLRRKMFAGSLRAVEEYLSEDRRLFVGGFDRELGVFQVLVRFDQQWVRCTVVYNQPSLCKLIPDQ